MRRPRRAVGPGYRPAHDPPRLLTLTPDFPPSLGGIQLYLQRLVTHLPGWEHRVVARGPGIGRPEPIARTRLTTGPVSNLELNARAVVEALRWSPDLVLCGHVVAAPAAAAIRRTTGVRNVLVGYADELTHRPRLTRMACQNAGATIAISRYTADLVRAGGPRGPVHTILPGFDVPAGVDRTGPGRTPRPTILTVARLADRYKGHDRVLEAMPAVLERVPDVQWLVAGDGPLRPELEARAQALGLEGRVVRFLGRVDDATRDELLATSHVFAMPSRLPDRGAGGEGFGIVYLEAAAAGLPVVAGNVAGALDAVAHGRTGLLVDPTDPTAIARALVSVLADPARAAEMGAAARTFASGFGWDRMGVAVDAVLRSVLDGAQQSLDRDRP